MAESSYDCIVIGSGPGGYVAAIRAAQLGLKTAVVERDKLGGRCLNYACIPAKAVLRSADLLSEIREAEEFGLKVSGVEVDYAAVQARREKVVTTLTSGVGGLFKKDGIDVIEGNGKLTADGDVLVDVFDAEPLTIAAGSVILATGSVPRPIPGVAVRRARDRHRGGVGAAARCPRAWPSSAPARPARRSPRRSRAWAARCCCWRRSSALLPTEDADISRLVERGLKRQGIARAHEHARRGRQRRRDERELLLRRGVGRGRLPGDLRRPRRRRRRARAWPRPASSSTSAA